ncbi:MAG: alpha/beta fold hydrolase [Leptolyngbya sp. SIO1E4]|nr:alpha/beta fold hydrolase [Leptolyngbya sp. SIO1E4]
MDDLARRIAKLSPQKRALLELQLLKKKGIPEPIAIVGIGCRFPGAPNRDAFWHLLQNGVDAITPVPRDRWDADTFYDPDATTPGKTYSREGGFLTGVDQFDPTFFGIAPREASFIDPQHRVFLEVVWTAIEDAGIQARQLSGSKTGVFVGISTNDYGQWLLSGPEVVDTYTTTGLASTMVANRLSYWLNLRGPSLAIDTACSSSLVAVHLACQSLRSGESEMAIAGGVNLILRPELTLGFSKLTALSPAGRCKAFDATADGFVRSEGAGAVILKPLSQAIQSGDPIYAVIRGSAVNQDGRSNGLTAPNREAQEKVIQAAFDQAGLSPQQVDYIEAHGTGTLLGDPIEAKALGQVLGTPANGQRRIPIGSVKSNIGHTEAAAGIASLIKTALCIRHATLVPSLHFQTPNPHIPFDQLPLKVQQQREPWPTASGKRTAGVSAFAFGGTNAHVVLEAAPEIATLQVAVTRPRHLLALSAQTPQALQAKATQFARWLRQATESLPDIGHTINRGRTHFSYRLAVTGCTREEVADGLTAAAGNPVKSDPAVVFLFTGQGSQYGGMGQQLYKTQPLFRETVDRCAEIISPYLDTPLIDVLFAAEAPDQPLHQTAYTQPALFVLEYALATLWQSWGIKPAAVLGHSVGEYVAACVAGILSVEDALRLVAQRGKLMQSLSVTGTMAAAFADEATVAQTLATMEEAVAIATLNGPTNTVIAGTDNGVDLALKHLKAQGIRTQVLHVSHAFHSPLMEPILPVFEHLAQQVDYAPARIPLALNVTGELLQPGDTLNAAYWRQHARAAVRFADGLQALYQQGFRCFLELGPQPVLCSMGRRCIPDPAVVWLPTLQRKQSEWLGVISSLGRLYEQGCAVDWQAFDRPYRYQRLHGLPTYPFQRQRYWVDVPDQVAGVKPLPVSDASDPAQQECLYEITWKVSPLPPMSGSLAADRWLVFKGQHGLGQALVDQLNAHGAAVTEIEPGAAFNPLTGHRGVLNPAEPDDFAALLSAIATPTGPKQQIVYLWGLDQSPESPEDLAAAGAGLLHLVQALVSCRQDARFQLWVVTQNAQFVGVAKELPAPMQAPLWGLGNTIALEHPEVWGGLVDLEGASSPSQRTAADLLSHFTAQDAEDRVAFRQGQRWGARLRSLPAELPESHPTHIQSDGTYLITGGLGALGLQVAQFLIRQGAKTLMLFSRRGERPEHLSTLMAMRRSGVTVHVEAVDVAEAEEVDTLIQDIQEMLPPLRGIVHAAGTLADGLLISQTWQQFQAVMRPKIQGAWNLHQAVQNIPLDFFVLFSSAASLLGSPGQGNYAAANAFLDVLAHMRRQQNLSAQTINWGPWQGEGLATQHQNTMQRLNARGIQSFSPEQGLRLFEQVLSQGQSLPSQVGVLQVDWGTLLPQLPTTPKPAFFTEVGAEIGIAQPNLLETLAALSIRDRARHLQHYLQIEVAQVLGRSDTISATSNLLDIGLDSLMVMDFLGICKRDLGLTLYPREVFEHPTLAALSHYLAQELERTAPQATAALPNSTQSPAQAPEMAFSVPIWGRDRTFPPVDHKNAPAIFLLSSPRSGSTLLRVMLAGHPALFCPPELHLLPFETLAERQCALADSYLDQGLQRALMALKTLDADTSQTLLTAWTEQGMTVPVLYQKLQTLAGDRVLVDKSPTYGFSLSTLQRAEQMFENAKYIHLVRHPYAVIDSFVRNRMDKIFDLPEQDPYRLANQVWTISNQNILDFLAQVDPTRHHCIRYEDLVTDPEGVIGKLCDFLSIPFHPSVLTPYTQQQERMTDGVNPQSLPIDDPNFHRRGAIDSTLADAWESVKLPVALLPSSQTLAHQLRYELPEEASPTIAPMLSTSAPLATLQETAITVRGLDLCVCTWGPETGTPILCLHGVLNQGAIWGAIAPALVQQGYRVIAPDLRGHGKSAHVGPEGNYQLLDHLGDIDALVQQLGLKTCHVVGHSMGAVIAASFASARPAYLQSLTLVEPVVPGDETDTSADQLATHLNYLAAPPTHPIYRDLSEAVDRFQKSMPALTPTWAETLTARIVEPVDGGVRWRWDPRLQVRTRFGLSGGTFTRDRYGQLLQHIQTPTTLIFGEQSDFNRPEDLTFQQQHLPHAAMVTLPGGHHLPLESPAEVAREVLQRLSHKHPQNYRAARQSASG